MSPQLPPSPDEERAPITGSWPRLYALVLALLAGWIAAFYILSVRYAPGP